MTDYKQKASDFLTKHGIKFSFKLANTKTPDWKDDSRHINHFIATLKQGKRKVSFDFFDSISNYEKGIVELDAYSVLSCCSSEINCPDTFEDFCSEFGYEEDSLKAEKTFKSLKKFSDKLKKFFDTVEIQVELSEIN